MAEHLNQIMDPEMDPLNQMGKPILTDARTAGYQHCKEMGLTPARAVECVNVVAEQLQRDQPYEAQKAGMKFLDLTGTYRLFAVMLCAAAAENAKPVHRKPKRHKNGKP